LFAIFIELFKFVADVVNNTGGDGDDPIDEKDVVGRLTAKIDDSNPPRPDGKAVIMMVLVVIIFFSSSWNFSFPKIFANETKPRSIDFNGT
jgi:hypothetical protein